MAFLLLPLQAELLLRLHQEFFLVWNLSLLIWIKLQNFFIFFHNFGSKMERHLHHRHQDLSHEKSTCNLLLGVYCFSFFIGLKIFIISFYSIKSFFYRRMDSSKWTMSIFSAKALQNLVFPILGLPNKEFRVDEYLPIPKHHRYLRYRPEWLSFKKLNLVVLILNFL